MVELVHLSASVFICMEPMSQLNLNFIFVDSIEWGTKLCSYVPGHKMATIRIYGTHPFKICLVATKKLMCLGISM